MTSLNRAPLFGTANLKFKFTQFITHIENRALLGYYAASSDNYRRFGTNYRAHPRVQDPEDKTEGLSRNVAKNFFLFC